MDRDELVDNLGTIARSGTRAFLDGLSGGAEGSALIGQFGVGFYSAFIVASSVEVTSRKAGSRRGLALDLRRHRAPSPSSRSPLDAAPARGTRVVLHLMDDAKTYAEQATIERVVAGILGPCADPDRAPGRRRRGGEDARRRQRAVAEAEGGGDRGRIRRVLRPCQPPVRRAGADHPLPRRRPERIFGAALRAVDEAVRPVRSRAARPDQALRQARVHHRRGDDPAGWLRFVRGVIDSEDLPLNLSREMLQKNPVLEAIGKGVTSRILADLDKLANDDRERYDKVWDAFGPVIKEGLYEDAERRDALYKIARFRTTTGGETWRSLADYVAALRPNQTAIYYALGDDRKAILASPQLEGFARRGVEVLVLSDPVDAFWVRTRARLRRQAVPVGDAGRGRSRHIPVAEGARRAEAAPEKRVGDARRPLQADARRQGQRWSAPRRASPRARSASSRPILGMDRQLEKILSAPRAAQDAHRAGARTQPDPPADQGAGRQGDDGRRRARRSTTRRCSSSARRASSTASRRKIRPTSARESPG